MSGLVPGPELTHADHPQPPSLRLVEEAAGLFRPEHLAEFHPDVSELLRARCTRSAR